MFFTTKANMAILSVLLMAGGFVAGHFTPSIDLSKVKVPTCTIK